VLVSLALHAHAQELHIPESAASMAGRLGDGEHHDVLVGGRRDVGEVRPVVGVVDDGRRRAAEDGLAEHGVRVVWRRDELDEAVGGVGP